MIASYTRLSLLLVILNLLTHSIYAQINHDQVKSFAKSYASDHGILESEVLEMLSHATYQPSIVEKMDRPAEKKLYWDQYRNIFLKDERIEAGVKFMSEYQDVLSQVSQSSGVPTEVIASIIGVETYFGRLKGSYKVLDALYTLAFAYPRRGKYFQSELAEFIDLTKKENLDIYTVKGSYAGAMGYSQFMPSSYRAYAVSYDEGTRDLLTSAEDAIASVANYLKVHRWRTGLPIASKAIVSTNANPIETTSPKVNNNVGYFVRQGYKPSDNWHPETKVALMRFESENKNEYWFGADNFYVITRYNHSPYYALAVFQLAKEIKSAAP